MIVSLFQRESIVCPHFTVDLETRDHHDTSEAKGVSEAMHKMIQSASQEMMIKSDEDMADMLEREQSKNGSGRNSKHCFDALQFTNDAVQNMKERLIVVIPYLYAVDKNKMTAQVSIGTLPLMHKILCNQRSNQRSC